MDYITETVNEIVRMIEKKISEFGHMDRATIYEELAGKMDELNQKELMDEYYGKMNERYGDDEYLLDGV